MVNKMVIEVREKTLRIIGFIWIWIMLLALSTILPYALLTEADMAIAWRVAVPVVAGFVATIVMFSTLFLGVRVKEDEKQDASK